MVSLARSDIDLEKRRALGMVATPLTITNHGDQIEAERGHRKADAVRSVTLGEVIVDTGATTLALPADVIAQLGLDLQEEVPILTAAGPATARLYRDARLTLLGREGTFDCLELPAGTRPLLGVIPLEALGLEPDLRHQRLRQLPREPGNTYFTL
jgi:predicted aspartyl protease